LFEDFMPSLKLKDRITVEMNKYTPVTAVIKIKQR